MGRVGILNNMPREFYGIVIPINEFVLYANGDDISIINLTFSKYPCQKDPHKKKSQNMLGNRRKKLKYNAVFSITLLFFQHKSAIAFPNHIKK